MANEPNIDDLFGIFRQTRFNEDADPNRVVQSDAPGTGNPQPVGWIQDGVITAPSFDTTAPAAPTGLTLSSDVVTNSDGTSYIRLLVGLTQPSDTDLFASYVEVTSNNDGGGPPAPVWDRPEIVLIGKGQTQNRVEDVQGNTQYWARARAADVLGNFSAYTSTVTHTTTRDVTPPPTPSAPTVTAGFRGFGAFWAGGDAADLAYYEVRWAQAASPPDGDDGAWTYMQTKATTVFVGNLTPDLLYWVEVRGVDISENQSAWTTGVSVTPNLIGSADIAANSISAAAGHISDLDADAITTGTLTVRPTGTMDGIEVQTAGGVTTIDLNSDGSMKFIDPTNPNRYLLLTSGVLKFTTDGGATFTTVLDPDGFYGDAVRLGSLPGGHNLSLNSSFELASFVTAGSTDTFTDNTGTPGWKAANRTTAPDNVTESTTLTATTLTYA